MDDSHLYHPSPPTLLLFRSRSQRLQLNCSLIYKRPKKKKQKKMSPTIVCQQKSRGWRVLMSCYVAIACGQTIRSVSSLGSWVTTNMCRLSNFYCIKLFNCWVFSGSNKLTSLKVSLIFFLNDSIRPSPSPYPSIHQWRMSSKAFNSSFVRSDGSSLPTLVLVLF